MNLSRVAVSVLAVTGLCFLAIGQQPQTPPKQQPQGKATTPPPKDTTTRDSTMHPDSMHHDSSASMGMCPMHGAMMGGIMQRTMVATSDGGVIMAVGDRLLKFDRNLNLQKDVEVKVDIQGMAKRMAGALSQCPACNKMRSDTSSARRPNTPPAAPAPGGGRR